MTAIEGELKPFTGEGIATKWLLFLTSVILSAVGRSFDVLAATVAAHRHMYTVRDILSALIASKSDATIFVVDDDDDCGSGEERTIISTAHDESTAKSL